MEHNKRKVILFQPSIGYMDYMRSAPTLPLGLLSCANLVSHSYEVKIIDQRLNSNWKETLRNCISKETLCVGVTSLTGKMITEGLKFSKYVKENYGLPVVWGGVHPTILPEQTVENKYVDIVVIGEGELTFDELVKCLDEKKSLADVKGICYKQNGKVVKTPKRDFVYLDLLPDLPYHLIDISKYMPVYKNRKSIFFESSRGCPYNCSFCYNNVVNKRRWRSMSADVTLEKITRLISKYKSISDIYFVDDEFFINIDRAVKIAEGLKKLSVSWQVQGVDIVCLKNLDDSFFKLLQESGCLRLTVGIESGSPRIREIMNKKGTVEDIVNVVTKLKKYNIILYCSFMIGIPGETIEDIKETIKLLFKIRKINPNIRNSPFYIYTPYPGTQMYEIFKNKFVNSEYKILENLEYWGKIGEWSEVKYKMNKDRLYTSLHFSTLFIDSKTKEYAGSKIIKILSEIYRPIAVFRVKKLCFMFMIEKFFYDLFRWLIKKMTLLSKATPEQVGGSK